MLLLLAITRYTNNCITVHRLHSDYEALPLRANKHIVQFHSTVFIIIDISTLDTTVDIPGKRRRGRPNLRWKDACKRDMTQAGLKEDNATNRAKWRKKLISYTGDPMTGQLSQG